MPRVARRMVCIACFLTGSLPVFAGCGAASIFVQGKVENAPRASSVTVGLVYGHGQIGESDRLVLDSSSFRTRVPFSTESRSFDFMGIPLGKCAHKPHHVIVVLMDGDQQVDCVTLSIARDFKFSDSSELAARADVILRGPK